MSEQERCERARPNVIWVFGDQHRGQALSCMGDPNVNTPNIDRLAAMGVNFVNAVSGFPLCSPFRGSMLTSKYCHKSGVAGHNYRMDTSLKTIAHPLNDAGYHTAYFGKWHVDKTSTARAAMHIVPPERRGGFQTWVGYENNNSQWDSWVHGGEGESAFHYRLDGYEPDVLTDMFIDYIRDRKKENDETGEVRPFFAALSVQPPHDPYVAPAEFMARHNPGDVELRPNVPACHWVEDKARRDLAGAYAMIENLDWNLGRIREALGQCGFGFNTHIIFFSDHGDMHGSHGQFKKTIPYEEAIRIPFIIGGEQECGYNRRGNCSVDAPVNHVDIAPTTLGLCGIAKPGWMDGTDYSHYRLLDNPKDDEPDSAYLQAVVASGHEDSVDKPWRGIVTNDGWKYVCFEGCEWLMFNLNDDPYEGVNLAHNVIYKDKKKELNGRLRKWIADTDDDFSVPNF